MRYLKTSRATAVQKFEYEDSGLTVQAFEAKVLEREKSGWHFLGEVSIETGKGFAKKLAFRKQPISFAPTTTVPNLPGYPGSNLPGTIPAGELPVFPGGNAPATNRPSDFNKATGAPPAAVDPFSTTQPTRDPALPETTQYQKLQADPLVAPPRPTRDPLLSGNARLQKLEADDAAKIAALEAELKAVKSGLSFADAKKLRLFRVLPSSGWNAQDLADVLRAIMDKESSVKKFGSIAIEVKNDMLSVTGSGQAFAEVAAWIEKLKQRETPMDTVDTTKR